MASVLLSSLRPQGPSLCCLNLSGLLLSWGLCTYNSSCLECFYSVFTGLAFFLPCQSEVDSDVFFLETFFLSTPRATPSLSNSQGFCSCLVGLVESISYALRLPPLFVSLTALSLHPVGISCMKAMSCFYYYSPSYSQCLE